MTKHFTPTRVLLFISIVALSVTPIIAQQADAKYSPLTIRVQDVTFAPDGSGSIVASELGAYTFRPDGSHVYEWAITSISGEIGRGRTIRDLEQRLETTMMYDLRVAVSRQIPESAVHSFRNAANDCLHRVDGVGAQEGDNPLRRRRVEADGAVMVARYYPEVGCQPLESSMHSPDGTLLASRRVLDSAAMTDESLFQVDGSLPTVTWADLGEAHEKRYGRILNNESKRMFADRDLLDSARR